MPTKTWIGTTANWSVASNWSPAALPTSTDDLVFNNSANCTVNVSYTFNSIDFNGYTGTFQNSGVYPLTVVGSNNGTATGISLRLSTGMTFNFTANITFTSSVGGYIISNGKTFGGGLLFNNATGSWTIQDAISSTANITLTSGTLTLGAAITQTAGTLGLTAGTLNLGTYIHNFNAFISSNANTRTLNFGTSTVNITGSGATIWNTSVPTNLTISGTNPTVNFTYSGGVGTRAIFFGALSEANSIDVNISAGTDTVSVSAANFKTLNFTGFSGSTTIGNSTIYKDVILSPTQTLSTVGTLNFVGTSVTQTITSNGLTIPGSITINSATTTFLINSNLTIGSANTFTLTAGTINANNGANITCGSFSSSNSNVRTLNMGWGTWNITGAGLGIGWILTTSTNITFNSQQSRIVFTNTTSSTVTFAGGDLTYYTVEYARGGGGGQLTIGGSNTFANFIDNTSTAAHSIVIAYTATNSFYNFIVRGSAGALVTITRGASGSFILQKLGRGIICNVDYVAIGTLMIASPANTWYVGANSTSGSGATWILSDAPSSQSILGIGGVG